MRAKRRAFLRYTQFPNQASYRDYVGERDWADWVKTVSREEYEERLAGVLTKTNAKPFFSYAKPQSARSSDFRMDLQGGISTQTLGEAAEAFPTFCFSVYAEDDHRPIGFLPPLSDARTEDILITSETVEKMPNRLPPNSAPGPDGIHPAMLRIPARVLAGLLARLFNTSLRYTKIPTDWKLANITPIFKKGNRREVGNYRPVNITSVVNKLMERIVREHILNFVERGGLIANSQHGFCRRRSCLSNLLATFDFVTGELDLGRSVDLCYFGFANAFDVVNHRLLFAKLKQFGLLMTLIYLIGDFLSNGAFRLNILGEFSDPASITSGVPQGSVLGPLLFLLYVNDLSSQLEFPAFLFADDLKPALSSADPEMAQRNIDALNAWVQDSMMRLNASKCQQLPLGRAVPLFLRIDVNQEIAGVHTVSDLGILIASSLSPSEQIYRAVQRARGVLFMIRKRFARITPTIVRKAYSALVRPHLGYAVQAWAPVLERDIKRHESVQRLTIRMVAGVHDLASEQRLTRLNLFSVERRRLRGF